MFENAGTKALSIVKVYVVFELIATFIIGLVYSIQRATPDKYSMYYEYSDTSNFKTGTFFLSLLVLALILFFVIMIFWVFPLLEFVFQFDTILNCCHIL